MNTRTANAFLDLLKACEFITLAIEEYVAKKAPGWFINWLDDLYGRVREDGGMGMTLDELLTLQKLWTDEGWMAPPLAVNMVFKLFDRLGRDTSGIIGY